MEKPTAPDRAADDVHGGGNPHIRLDPRQLFRVANALASRRQAIDAENSAEYRQQLQRFGARWEQALMRWQQQSADLIIVSPLNGMIFVLAVSSWRTTRMAVNASRTSWPANFSELPTATFGFRSACRR
jgi:zinc/manganese transport system substrate-binding protein